MDCPQCTVPLKDKSQCPCGWTAKEQKGFSNKPFPKPNTICHWTEDGNLCPLPSSYVRHGKPMCSWHPEDKDLWKRLDDCIGGNANRIHQIKCELIINNAYWAPKALEYSVNWEGVKQDYKLTPSWFKQALLKTQHGMLAKIEKFYETNHFIYKTAEGTKARGNIGDFIGKWKHAN